MDENKTEVQELKQQLVQAQTTHQIELIDQKLEVLKKHQQ